MAIFTGDIFAETYTVSSSVTNVVIATTSGSTAFGDSVDDTHTFLGNTISGSATSTASFGYYQGVTTFGGADGTETLFSGSLTSTGSFGRVEVPKQTGGGPITLGGGAYQDVIVGDGSGTGDLVLHGNSESVLRYKIGGAEKWFLRATSGNFIEFRRNSQNYFRIDGTGNVGINLNNGSPSEKLHVQGNIFATGNISGSSTSTGSFGHLNIDGPGLTISDNKTASVSGNSSIICVGSGSMPIYYGNVIGVKHATNATFKLQTDVSGSEVGSGFEFGLGSVAYINNREIIDHVVYGTNNTETMRHHYSPSGNIVGIHSGYVGLANSGGAGITLGGLNTVTRVKVCSSQTGIGANNGLEFIMSTGDAIIFNRESADMRIGTGNSSDQLKIINGTDSQLLRLDGSKISGSADSVASFGELHIADKVGIGNTTPGSFYNSKLVVGAGASEENLTLYAGGTNPSGIFFADSTSGNGRFSGQIYYNHETDKMQFATGYTGASSYVLELMGNKISGSATSTGSFGRVEATTFAGDGAGLSNVPDYVFEPEYVLRSLSDVETYVSQSKHLPGIPGMDELDEWKKYSVGDRDMLLLEKIEELTLYVIRLEKRIKDLENN